MARACLDSGCSNNAGTRYAYHRERRCHWPHHSSGCRKIESRVLEVVVFPGSAENCFVFRALNVVLEGLIRLVGLGVGLGLGLHAHTLYKSSSDRLGCTIRSDMGWNHRISLSAWATTSNYCGTSEFRFKLQLRFLS